MTLYPHLPPHLIRPVPEGYLELGMLCTAPAYDRLRDETGVMELPVQILKTTWDASGDRRGLLFHTIATHLIHGVTASSIRLDQWEYIPTTLITEVFGLRPVSAREFLA